MTTDVYPRENCIAPDVASHSMNHASTISALNSDISEAGNKIVLNQPNGQGAGKKKGGFC